MDEATFQEYLSFVNYYIHQVNLIACWVSLPVTT